MRKIAPHDRTQDAVSVRHPVVGLVDNVRSIYNVGSIFRTADAAWIRHLYLTGFTGTPDHRKLHKTALGAQDTIPWTASDNPAPVLDQLRADGYTLAALEITDTPTPTDGLDLEQYPVCLVVGNEVEGVQSSILQKVDIALEIPQYGSKHSMNVSVAFGIAVFDLVRRYRSLQHPSSEVVYHRFDAR